MRCFIAIDLPSDLKHRVATISAQLRQLNHNHPLRWVAPDHLHVTLQFIGDVSTDLVPKIIHHVQQHINSIAPMALQFGKLCLFPSPRKPRLIILRVGPDEALLPLAQAVAAGVQAAGVEIDKRPFVGHLSLARLKDRCRPKLVDDYNFNDFTLNDIVLYQSTPSEQGSVYTPLHRFPLNDQAEYGYFDHEADMGIIGRGSSIEDAFCNAARALFALQTDLSAIQAQQRIDIEFAEPDTEYALVIWLNLLINKANIKKIAVARFELQHQDGNWSGSAWGEPWREDIERGIEVKGATLTELAVRQHGSTWEARCVVDV